MVAVGRLATGESSDLASTHKKEELHRSDIVVVYIDPVEHSPSSTTPPFFHDFILLITPTGTLVATTLLVD